MSIEEDMRRCWQLRVFFTVVVLVLTNANLFVGSTQFVSEYDQWAELITWAGCPAGLLAVGESEMPW
jgi:hypothetical protein